MTVPDDYPVADIDLGALRHNFSRVKSLAGRARVMSVIKADAYGHGMQQVATTLRDSDAFAVARLEEGIALRRQGIVQPIVLLEGVSNSGDLVLAAENRLSPVFHHPSQIAMAEQTALTTPLTFCWMMVDSGMHRLGIRPQQAEAMRARLAACPHLVGDIGLMSHFANSDLVGDARNQAQLDHMLALKQTSGVEICLANSAAVMTMSHAHQDWVRPGLMLYGISPFDDRSAEAMDLRPVMQLRSRLIAVYDLYRGEQLGYGGDWIAPRDTRVGVASIGYGDGYSRHLSNKASVWINDRLARIIGRVSMDTICIDLNDIAEAAIGDPVLLWGSAQLPVEALARHAGTIPYELVTVVCGRVRRNYIDG